VEVLAAPFRSVFPSMTIKDGKVALSTNTCEIGNE
jgi:hypothetical protein